MERSSSPHVDALSLTAGPSLLLAGDVLRTDVADFAVRREVVLDGGAPQSMALVRVSRETAPDPKVAEPAMLGPVLPSAIRFLLLDGAPAAEIRETCGKWAEDVHLASDRMSPAELPSAELVRKRAADYRKSFADLFKRPPTGGREAVGVVVLFEGALASFETFADGKSFAAAWPRLLDGIATEAVVLEARQRSLEIDIPDPADPDRFLSDMKQKLLGVYGARPVERDLLDSGRHLEFALDAATARALVRGDNQVVHFVLLTDPARRGEKRPSEDPDLNAARRKLRPTEEEKRRLERHDDPPPPPK